MDSIRALMNWAYELLLGVSGIEEAVLTGMWAGVVVMTGYGIVTNIAIIVGIVVACYYPGPRRLAALQNRPLKVELLILASHIGVVLATVVYVHAIIYYFVAFVVMMWLTMGAILGPIGGLFIFPLLVLITAVTVISLTHQLYSWLFKPKVTVDSERKPPDKVVTSA